MHLQSDLAKLFEQLQPGSLGAKAIKKTPPSDKSWNEKIGRKFPQMSFEEGFM